MKTFKFTAYGENFVTEAETSAKAMSAANRHWFHRAQRNGRALAPGAWMENGATEFTWVEGNFFD